MYEYGVQQRSADTERKFLVCAYVFANYGENISEELTMNGQSVQNVVKIL